MRRLLLALAVLLSAAGAAQAQNAVFRQFKLDAVMEADGRGVQTLTIEILANTEAAARQIAAQTLAFSTDTEQVRLLDAFTRKADGRTIKPAPEAVRLQDDPAAAGAAGFGDRKRVLVAMPEVGPGDSVVLTWRRQVREPAMPGLLAFALAFPRGVEWVNAAISLDVPADLPLAVEAHGLTPETTLADKRRVLRWAYSAKAIPEDQAALVPLEGQPRLFVSSMANWPAFADAWMALAAPRMAVTPAVQSLSDSIVGDTADKAAQAALIHAWMMRNIRGLPLAPGSGSFVPHAADAVIAAGAGDAKDHAALTIALLAARGIEAVPLLLNAGNASTLPAPPSFASFNQVIVYIPALDAYVDTATFGTPYGLLLFGAYGKPAVLARNGGSSLHGIPPLAPGVATTVLRSRLRIEPDGRMPGESTAEASGPFVIEMRRNMLAAQAADAQRAGQPPVSPGGLDPQASVSGRFDTPPQPGLLEGDPFPMPFGLRLLRRPGDMLLGPLEARSIPGGIALFCHAGRQEEMVELRLPPGTRLGRVPKDVLIDTPEFTYATHWGTADGLVTVRRVLESRLTVPLCEGATAAAMAEGLQRIRRDLRTALWLESD